jgi:predicted acetyltransferase
MTELELTRPQTDADLDALAGMLGWAFGPAPAEARAWLERGGLENARLARRDAKAVGGLLEIPMGQWFGGRSVPMLGLAGVAVVPEARGQRVALTLVTHALREARERGFALSTLYPATVTLYRACGYELAGTRMQYRTELRQLPVVKSELEVVPIAEADAPAVEALYSSVARERPGYLDRGSYVWQRVRAPNRKPASGFAVRGVRGIEGYAYLSRRGSEEEPKLALSDFMAATPEAAARLLTLCADHRSTVTQLSFHAGLAEPAVLLLPERVFQIELSEHWMLRVNDVALALTGRGYPELTTRVDFEISDDVLPENAGRYRVEFAGGRASVRPGGDGHVRLDVRALAALYSGFLSPFELVRYGRLSAAAGELSTLAALFAGSPPAMPDFF